MALALLLALGAGLAVGRPGRAAVLSEAWQEPDPAQFFRDVQRALANRDATAMAMLVDFPLHLREADGSEVSLDNARALQLRFDEAFPAALRAAVAGSAPADLTRRRAGARDLVGFAGGLLWATRSGGVLARLYRLTEVDALSDRSAGSPGSRSEGLQAVCETGQRRLLIDRSGGGVGAAGEAGRWRYRVWNKPHLPPAAPDLELTDGVRTTQGGGACAASTWTFSHDGVEYRLRQVPCPAGEAGAPAEARGQLSVRPAKGKRQSWWCITNGPVADAEWVIASRVDELSDGSGESHSGRHGDRWAAPDLPSFIHDFDGAVARLDADALALLSGFPLRLHLADGSALTLENPRALQVHLDEAFPESVRQEVAQSADRGSMRQSDSAVGIAGGSVWAALRGGGEAYRYLVRAVYPAAAVPVAGLVAVCETARYRVAIDAPDGSAVGAATIAAAPALRYRVWNKPHLPPEAPDMEVEGGRTKRTQDSCGTLTWTFEHGDTTYRLAEVSCGADEAVPATARAALTVELRGKRQGSWWCY